MSEATRPEPEVITRVEGAVGRITLDRPAALHALNTAMIDRMTEALLAWRGDSSVEMVLIDHAGERGFCAGGDIRMLAESGANDGLRAREFFFHEYRLNALLFGYPKPTVAVMDGITMGGGVGLALPCRYRVATERTTFAMPETGIGLFPDVGAGWHLGRMPDNLGLWLALTGARIKAADCEFLRIATDTVAVGQIERLKSALLAKPHDIAAVLKDFRIDPSESGLASHHEEIRDLFCGCSIEAVVEVLAAASSPWAGEQLAILKTKSPQALKIALRQLRGGALARTFAENMRTEYRIAARVVGSHDFLEGVRAIIVDKDNTPKWKPTSLAGVTDADLDAIFAPLSPAREWRPILEPSE